MYVEVSYIVDGALEESVEIHDDLILREYLRDLADDAADHGYPAEVYVLQHDHEPGIECECVQYVQDHRPVHTFNER